MLKSCRFFFSKRRGFFYPLKWNDVFLESRLIQVKALLISYITNSWHRVSLWIIIFSLLSFKLQVGSQTFFSTFFERFISNSSTTFNYSDKTKWTLVHTGKSLGFKWHRAIPEKPLVLKYCPDGSIYCVIHIVSYSPIFQKSASHI